MSIDACWYGEDHSAVLTVIVLQKESQFSASSMLNRQSAGEVAIR